MDSSLRAGRAGRGPAGFTLLAILVVLAALTLVVGMALQRGEDERRSAILVRHEALALSAAEYGLDRARGYVGSILDNEVDLDKALDPLLNSNCAALPQFDLDGGTADDNLPTLAGGTKVALSGADRPFMRFPYDADGDGTPEGAYLVRIDDNDDDADGPTFKSSTDNNIAGALDCREGPVMLTRAARTNPMRDRDRTVVVTVVGIAPGTDTTRAQARKVLRARLGSPPAAGLITGGSIELKGASHVCGSYGSVSVSNGGFEDGCVCGKNCHGGPADQSCGNGNACNVQTSNSTCSADFGGGGGSCTTGAAVPPPPRVEVWSKLNAPPACTAAPCTPFYYLRADKLLGLGTDKAQVYMWNYSTAGCSNPQAFARIPYPGEPLSVPALCWKLVYNGNTSCSSPGDKVRIKDDASLNALNPPDLGSVCGSAPVVWKVNTTVTAANGGTCDDATTLYPDVGDNRYKRHYRTGGSVSYLPDTSPIRAPIPHGVWLVDGTLAFKSDTPGFTAVGPQPAQGPVTILATGDVTLDNGTVLSLTPAHRDVALLAGRDLLLGNGNTKLLTCGDPSSLPPTCPSAAIMVYEQFSMGSNTHLQGQLVVQNAGTCSGTVTGKAIETAGNSTISIPALPPISASSGAAVLSWSESSL